MRVLRQNFCRAGRPGALPRRWHRRRRAAGISPCPGLRQRDDEEAEAFAVRQATFATARAACVANIAESRAAAEVKAQQRALDKATATRAFVPSGAKERPLKQARCLTKSRSAQIQRRTWRAAGSAPASRRTLSRTSCSSAGCCPWRRRAQAGARRAARRCWARPLPSSALRRALLRWPLTRPQQRRVRRKPRAAHALQREEGRRSIRRAQAHWTVDDFE